MTSLVPNRVPVAYKRPSTGLSPISLVDWRTRREDMSVVDGVVNESETLLLEVRFLNEEEDMTRLPEPELATATNRPLP